MSYTLKTNVYKIISEYELDEDREKYLNMQNDYVEPILYCNCSKEKIPMILTEHPKGPHLRTKSNLKITSHYKFCRHYHDKNNNAYKSAIENENGKEIFHIDWRHDDLYLDNRINDIVYRKKYAFLYNNRSSVTQNKMTFDAFVKYKNMKYFEIYQLTEFKKNHDFKFDLVDFSKRLYGAISNACIGKSTIKDAGRGKFIYKYVNRIDDKTYREKNRIKIEANDSFIFCTKQVYSEALRKFERTYNNLVLENLINRDDLFIVCYGMISGEKYPVCKNMGFMLVNKYGLFCESLNEVTMFNMICDFIFHHNLQGKYWFYKPTKPEDDYANPNYVSDGVIRNHINDNKVIVEVFGRNEQEYIERKEQKKNTCKHKLIFWDVLDQDTLLKCEKQLAMLLKQ